MLKEGLRQALIDQAQTANPPTYKDLPDRLGLEPPQTIHRIVVCVNHSRCPPRAREGPRDPLRATGHMMFCKLPRAARHTVRVHHFRPPSARASRAPPAARSRPPVPPGGGIFTSAAG